jgi:homopolymeric O-antigen transport system permease protein
LTHTEDIPVFDIQPSSGWRLLNLRELWSYRELVYFLTWRDIKVRYKQTALGVIWAVLQPLAMMIVFSLFFRRFAGASSEGVPYPLFTLTALLPWQLFSRAITESTNSLVTDQRLITRVYFPRIIVPVSSTLAALVDFLITSVLLIGLVAWYRVPMHLHIVWVPFFLILMTVTALGVGFWLSALNVEYRDVAYTIPFLNQFLFFLTPVVYSSTVVPERWRSLYGLNPLAGAIEGFRWAVVGSGEAPSPMVGISTLIATFLFVSGIIWFRRRERTFVDSIGSGGR